MVFNVNTATETNYLVYEQFNMQSSCRGLQYKRAKSGRFLEVSVKFAPITSIFEGGRGAWFQKAHVSSSIILNRIMAALFAAKRKRAEKNAQIARVDFDELAQLTNDKRKRMPDESGPEVSLFLQFSSNACGRTLSLSLSIPHHIPHSLPPSLSHSDSPCSLSE